ncbi:protein translocase subunit secB [Rhodovulum imhoffii]|uniref:Protein-export protein SecB n=1 Tax=Rhodovulum imhoffii TaxID=365340 RepID=A0A2T5BRS9_9RHOB|nr:protein-export chaperone SecB [Rhodovulum imhoffii]MBK5934039.1 protein-export chaperone SecB [Rhodovulum imhoffii]PTN01924.1 protein translocase subunit secB [Rhodovulum imhoffii]
MTEPTAGNGTQPPQMKMHVLGQFVRDMSFENMLMRQEGNTSVDPDIQVQVGLDARKRNADHQYEVISKFNISSKNKSDGATMFLLELEYAGVFHIENVPEDQIHPFLMIECPRLLFPFVRRIVSDVTRDGGFPPLNLENVDFLQLYRQEILRRAEAKKADNETADA